MEFPTFFDQAPQLQTYDALSQFLGATPDGLITYTYADAVKLAGHSCPTVAGTYLSVIAALKALYPDEVPQRGQVSVLMPATEDEGVMGVMAQVCTLLTGAAGAGGFKGIAGRFKRNNLLKFNKKSSQSNGIVFTRIDNGKAVGVIFDASTVPMSNEQRMHMAAAISGTANQKELGLFAHAWQERVKGLLERANDGRTVIVRPLN